jgi:hypothetical protein
MIFVKHVLRRAGLEMGPYQNRISRLLCISGLYVAIAMFWLWLVTLLGSIEVPLSLRLGDLIYLHLIYLTVSIFSPSLHSHP